MGQRLALVAVEKNDVACIGLLFAQVQAQAHPLHLAFRLMSLQRVAAASRISRTSFRTRRKSGSGARPSFRCLSLTVRVERPMPEVDEAAEALREIRASGAASHSTNRWIGDLFQRRPRTPQCRQPLSGASAGSAHRRDCSAEGFRCHTVKLSAVANVTHAR